MINEENPRILLTVKEFCRKHSAFTEGSLRHLIFQSRPGSYSGGHEISGNGLKEAGAIVRIGRRLLIDEAKFFQWVDAINNDPGA